MEAKSDDMKIGTYSNDSRRLINVANSAWLMGLQSERLSTFMEVPVMFPDSRGFASILITDFCLLSRPSFDMIANLM